MNDPQTDDSTLKCPLPSFPLSRWLPRVLLLAALVSLVVALLMGRPTHFNHAVWYANTDPETFDAPRSRMTSDLIRNHLKIGMPRSESRTLLGPPDASAQVTAGPEGRFTMSDTDSYSLGFIGHAKDITTLDLHYSEKGALVKVNIVRR
jgi:hypothetical protein